MKIDDFTPSSLLLQTRISPNAKLTLVFDNDEDPISFFENYIVNSSLQLLISKSKRNTYLLSFMFPKHDYTLTMEPPETENSVYEEMLDKQIEIFCGYKLPDGKINAYHKSYFLENKITLN
ncbi:MAG: hypothetical protein IPM42_13975 [Saprospiraceae bacterium]|nr:hypothetical protein [Saprospiraceae bacterium]